MRLLVVSCAAVLVACSGDPAGSESTQGGAGGGGGAASSSHGAGAHPPGATGSSASATSASTSASTGGAAGGPASPSGEAIPVDDIPGFELVFSDDFNVDAPLGAFPGGDYAAGWTVYESGWKDTSKNGTYAPDKTLSVSGGVLHIDCRTEGGVHEVAAPLPNLGAGQRYGRYAVRFRATQMTGDYKTAWLLWPDSEQWPADGEVDFPEGNLDASMSAFAHHANPNGGQDAFPTPTTYADWHTAVLEWTPDKLQFFLDGASIGISTTEVPHNPMHWVLQTETNLDGHAPSDASVGSLEIDWVAMWRVPVID